MLYKKKDTPRLEQGLFKSPTAEYRGTPFWAWNCKLEQKELERQLEVFKKMGLGGAHMHVRVGLATEYLGDEFMQMVKACVDKAKSLDMLAWLYDEDRWPSGTAGGMVTKDECYRGRYLLFTPFPYGTGKGHADMGDGSHARADRAENGRLLACYDVELNEKGYLVGWEMIEEQTPAKHEKWYAYLEVNTESSWYNNQAYVNTLDKKAIDRFIEITYERYKREIGDEFGKTVPAIFTDEPQFVHKQTLQYATEKKDVILPWTDDLADTFAAAYNGEDILGGLPELIWERADGMVSVLRYHYHDHVCERFASAFADNCGNWCKEHGLKLTGHMMEEPTLGSQTAALGEAMRSYRSFGLPGIDMLSKQFEFTTAKQAQSAVHQYGREGMTSELYGVTNWDFDFRGHKLHGDWQAALGVTVRVHHLSWVSMAGEAKRDYPASINYQSPWWEQYSYVEDHFARVNTALTRGKPIVKVGVIHPVESYWLHWGPADKTALVRDSLDENFRNLTQWLLFGGIDFDFISESLLPDLCTEAGAPLKVGEMEYDAILVPGCETLRSTTLDCLEGFAKAGGRLIFAGTLPTLEDARQSDRGLVLAKEAQCISFNRGTILSALEPVRQIEIRNAAGAFTGNLLHQFREDGDGRWLFVAHAAEPYNKDLSFYQDVRIRLKGKWKVSLYNTMNGEVEDIEQSISGNMTEVYRRMYNYDSLLLWIEPMDISEVGGEKTENGYEGTKTEQVMTGHTLKLSRTVPYTLSEPNVLILDQAEYALDHDSWKEQEEILRIDELCRRQLNWPSRRSNKAQPWVTPEEPIGHMIHLRWRILSEIECTGIQLAIEDAERLQLRWNGENIANTVTGWYVDKSIKTVALPTLRVGENILEATIPFGKSTNLEWAYLLGDFGVEVAGSFAHIIPARKELAFGNILCQGLPFYGGNITYHIPVETQGGELMIRSSQYRGVLQTVNIDDGTEFPIIYPPYTVSLGKVEEGKHVVNITLCGHRRNSFGAVHLTDRNVEGGYTDSWTTEDEKWSYEYVIFEEGILTMPTITEKKYI